MRTTRTRWATEQYAVSTNGIPVHAVNKSRVKLYTNAATIAEIALIFTNCPGVHTGSNGDPK